MSATLISLSAGRWFVEKYQRQASELGTQHAARNMRKQGVPLFLALAVLASRRPVPEAARPWRFDLENGIIAPVVGP